ncbi:MAG: hypothetical protein ACOX7K_08900 [Oscillospiraceae bacterium]|jgi:hypothetical protein
MKKRMQMLLIAALLTGMFVIPSHAITTGQWDFEAGHRYAQEVAEEMTKAQEPEPEEEQPEVPQNQIDLLRRAIAEQIAAAKAFWRNDWRR